MLQWDCIREKLVLLKVCYLAIIRFVLAVSQYALKAMLLPVSCVLNTLGAKNPKFWGQTRGVALLRVLNLLRAKH